MATMAAFLAATPLDRCASTRTARPARPRPGAPGCGDSASTAPSVAASPAAPAATVAPAAGEGPTAQDVVDDFAAAELPVPKPRDNTAGNCPSLGCTQLITTDAVSVMRFDDPAAEEHLAETFGDGAHAEGAIVLQYAAAARHRGADWWARAVVVARAARDEPGAPGARPRGLRGARGLGAGQQGSSRCLPRSAVAAPPGRRLVVVLVVGGSAASPPTPALPASRSAPPRARRPLRTPLRQHGWHVQWNGAMAPRWWVFDRDPARRVGLPARGRHHARRERPPPPEWRARSAIRRSSRCLVHQGTSRSVHGRGE